MRFRAVSHDVCLFANNISVIYGACSPQCREDIKRHTDMSSATVDCKVQRHSTINLDGHNKCTANFFQRHSGLSGRILCSRSAIGRHFIEDALDQSKFELMIG